MDLSTVIEKAIPHILTGTGGAVAAVLRFTRGIVKRLEVVESTLESLKIEDASAQVRVENLKKELFVELNTLRQVLQVLRQDFESEVEDIETTFKNKAKERADTRRLLTRLTERYIVLESRLETAEAAINTMNESLKDFMTEQQKQWQTTAKSLGQIEGYLRGTGNKTLSGKSFPPVK